ncbi:MAG: hypothetical protein ACREM8_09300 [Vulcanimicrobiaceae bacterium]
MGSIDEIALFAAFMRDLNLSRQRPHALAAYDLPPVALGAPAPEPEAPAPAPEAPALVTTVDDITLARVLREFAQARGVEEATRLVGAFGVARVTQLSHPQRIEFIQQVQAALV